MKHKRLTNFISASLVYIMFLSSCGPTQNSYTINWLNHDGSVLEVDEKVLEGTIPTYDGATPTKQSDAQYRYLFRGWSPTVSEATSNVSYIAQYISITQNYTVSWYNYDSTLLQEDSVAYGSIPEYKGETPTRTNTDQIKYVFTGWNKQITPVTGDVSYYAVYNNEPQSYSVTFKNYDGTVLEEEEYTYGSTPSYKGNTPTKQSDEEYEYTFSGWDKSITAVTGEATYTATFSPSRIKFNISFDLNGGSSNSYVASKEISSLNKNNFFFDVNHSSLVFKGWSCNDQIIFDENGNLINNINLSDGLVFKAVFANTANISLVNNMPTAGEIQGGGEFNVFSYQTLSATAYDGYIFIGWYIGDNLLSTESEFTYFVRNKDETITAIFERDSYKLAISSYNSSLGDILDNSSLNNVPSGSYSKNYQYLDQISILAVSKSNVPFLGWFNGDELVSSNLIYSFTMPSTNLSLVAKWDEFNVTFDLQGGEFDIQPDPLTFTSSDNFLINSKINNPHKLGYIFDGWSINNVKTDSIDGSALKDIILEANWVKPSDLSIFDYEISNNNIKIIKVVDKEITNVNIPNSVIINGIDYNVSAIESSAFSNCSLLTSIVIPNSVTSIGDSAFSNCSLLTIYCAAANKPSGWNTNWNPSNRPVIWGYTGEQGIYNIFNYITRFDNNGDKYIAIQEINDKTLTEIIVPEEIIGLPVKEIKGGAFSGCSSLVSITLPFVGGNKNATIASASTLFGYIFGTSSYANSTSITQLYYGSSSDSKMYYIPSSLREVTITGGNVLYGAFCDCSLLTSITIPSGVTTIGGSTFYNCSSLTTINIPNTVTSIGEFAFYNCHSLTSINIPNVVTSIGGYAFYNCSSLISIVIPNTVTSIGQAAFDACSSLTIYCGAISKPNGWDSYWNIGNRPVIWGYAGDQGTYNHLNYMSYYDNEGNKYITVYGIEDKTLTEIIVPETIIGLPVKEIKEGAFSGCSSLVSITLPYVGGKKDTTSTSESTVFGYIFGSTSYEGGVSTTQFYSSSYAKAYYIPSSLREVTITGGNILYGAFYNCSSLTSITVPSTVTTIGNNAFYNCSSLTTIVIPNTVTSIGSGTFYNCSSLTIYCQVTNKPSGWNTNWNSSNRPVVWNYAGEQGMYNHLSFASYFDKSKKYIAITGIDDKTFTEVVVPNTINGLSVAVITDNAFYGCSFLTSITIPSSVTTIGEMAFKNCSSLTIYCGVANRPSGWNTNWNPNNRPVVWNYAGEHGIYNHFYYASSVDVNGDLYILINGIDDMTLTKITIPEVIAGLPVKEITNSAFSGCNKLISVTIPDTVTSIGSSAFSGCSSLKSITLPFVGGKKDATSSSESTLFGYIFGTSSYANSTSITQFYSSSYSKVYYIPSSLKEVTITGGNVLYGAFFGCSSLTSITIPSTVTSIASAAFDNCSSLTTIIIPNTVTSIGEFAFYNCSSLTSINIPDTVTVIRNYTFYNCSSLTSINIPDTVTSIGSRAFYNCSSLKSIIIPNKVTSIGESAFYNCSRLTSIVVPDGVTSIPGSTFSGCSSLKSITLPFIGGNKNATTASASTLFGYIFGSTSYEGSVSTTQFYSIGSSYSKVYYIPSSLKEVTITGGNILYGAFQNCSSLTSITIPSGITSIGERAFNNCSSLTSITIPDTVTVISNYMFENCSSLTSITIPNSVISIGNKAFQGCSSLTSIAIPSGITSIGNYAFENCSSLTSIIIPNKVTSIGESAFLNCSSLTIHCEVASKPNGWYGWNPSNRPVDWGYAGEQGTYNHLNYIPRFDGKNNKYIIIVGIDDKTLTEIVIPETIGESPVKIIEKDVFLDCSSLTSITIPNSVISIGNNAFKNCSHLTSVTIPSGVTSIGSQTFYNCSSLTSINVPNSITSIGESAFYNCSLLTSINIPDVVTYIGRYAFYNCSLLTTINVPNTVTSIGEFTFYNCSSLTTINVPNSITSIGESAFYNCSSLTSINIPDVVTYIGSYAFYNCSKLTSIIIPVGVKSIQKSTFSGCSSLTLITIPSAVTTIGSYAFSNCSSLTSIIVPNKVTSIGESTFSGCSSLTSMTLPFVGGNKNATTASASTLFGYIFGSTSYIGSKHAFQYYSANQYVTYYIPSSLKEVTITGGNILYGAFSSCSPLTSVIISKTVTSVGYWGFGDCPSLTIYCQVASKPSGWDSYWNPSNRPVVWGYTKE